MELSPDNTKYKIRDDLSKTLPDGTVVFRIEAIQSIVYRDNVIVPAGTVGGFVERYANLSQTGTCWVGDDAVVCNEASVQGGAVVGGTAVVRGKANVTGTSYVHSNAVLDGACIVDSSNVFGDAHIGNSAVVTDSTISGAARIYGMVTVSKSSVADRAAIFGYAVVNSSNISDSVDISGNAEVDRATITGDARINGIAKVPPGAQVGNHAALSDPADVLVITAIDGQPNRNWTAYITEYGKVRVFYQRRAISLREYRDYVNQHYALAERRATYLAAAKLARQHFKCIKLMKMKTPTGAG